MVGQYVWKRNAKRAGQGEVRQVLGLRTVDLTSALGEFELGMP